MARSRRVFTLALVAALFGLVGAIAWTLATDTDARAQLRPPAPSDERAAFFLGNVVTCSGAGFPFTIQMGSPSNTSASDANIEGTVAPNDGTTQPGQGQEVNIEITGENVVIDAVIVKGGAAYNVYTDPTVLPPALASPQHYIAPLNVGGNVPNISHWFVCYHITTPPPSGSLTVEKAVLAPDGLPVDPLPTSYSALVNCNDGNPAHQDVTVTFSLGGGRATGTPTLTGIPPGTVCTVVEQNTDLFPEGSVVTYVPPEAPDPGVTIEGDAGVVIGIINDFTGVEVQQGTIAVTKVVTAAPGVVVPESFIAHVTCDDGTDADVTLPGGTGGPGTPAVSVNALALCFVAETTTLPPDWVVTYSVDGGPATPTPPIVGPIAGNATVTVGITNEGTGTTTTTTVAPPTTDPGNTTTTGAGTNTGGGSGGSGAAGTGSGAGGDLPFTGSGGIGAVAVALVSLGTGVALLIGARRRARRVI